MWSPHVSEGPLIIRHKARPIIMKAIMNKPIIRRLKLEKLAEAGKIPPRIPILSALAETWVQFHSGFSTQAVVWSTVPLISTTAVGPA